jgi:hypothetical protein
MPRGFSIGSLSGVGSVSVWPASNYAIARSTGFNNTTGVSNAFFGRSAGNGNTTGSGNSFVGDLSGRANTTGSNNTFIGRNADFLASVATGDNDTLLGAFAKVVSGVNNATAIGYSAIVTQSNSLVLGGINGVNGATADTNVGIGTTSPSQKLHVRGSDSRLRLENTDSGAFAATEYMTPSRQWHTGVGGSAVTSGVADKYYIADLTLFQFRMVIDTSGKVGIGTLSPDQLLTVNGGASKPSGGSWATFSDERLKTIKGRFTSGLNEVMQLQPIRYEYRPDNAMGIKSSGEQIGFGAQAVQKVIPEAVTENDRGYLLVNNDPIMWTMLNAIKEQQQQIGKQQIQIEALKNLVCADHPNADVCK